MVAYRAVPIQGGGGRPRRKLNLTLDIRTTLVHLLTVSLIRLGFAVAVVECGCGCLGRRGLREMSVGTILGFCLRQGVLTLAPRKSHYTELALITLSILLTLPLISRGRLPYLFSIHTYYERDDRSLRDHPYTAGTSRIHPRESCFS